MEEKTLNFFDKFLYKLIIGLVMLLSVVLLDKFEVLDLDDIKGNMSSNLNVLDAIRVMNGKVNIIHLGTDEELAVSGEYQEYENVGNKMRIKTDEMSGVKNYIAGVVVKVVKEETYTITILGIDNKTYVYENLEQINCHIYSYLKTNEIIGTALGYYDLEIGN